MTAAMKVKDVSSLEGKPSGCIKKQRHHFADKYLSSQSYGFPVVMYGCESWTIKKAECRRIDAFKKQRPKFADKGLVKATVFLEVVYGCELDYKES